MNDLIAFLSARLDEDEAAAKNNLEGGLSDDGKHPPSWPDYQTYDSEDLNVASAYIEIFRPRRMLREVESKRAIVKRHRPGEDPASFGPLEGELYCEAASDDEDLWYAKRWPCPDILAVAAIYSDHPDYQDEWKS